MSKLELTIAVSEYDHVRDFASGVVTAEGIDAKEIVRRLIEETEAEE